MKIGTIEGGSMKIRIIKASDFIKDNYKDMVDWMHDDITWCRRKCPNKECFRNQVNRRLKAGLISVADMYKEGECPKEAVLG